MSAEWKKVELGETWDFEKDGHEVMGLFIGKDEGVGDNKSTIYNLEVSGNKVVGVWGSAVLDVRMKHVKVGEEVKIVFLGREMSPKTKRQYKNFDVYHRMPVMDRVEDSQLLEDTREAVL